MLESEDQFLSRPSQTGLQKYKVPLRTARLARSLLALVVLITVVAVWSDIMQLRLFRNVQQGVTVSDSEIELNDARQACIGVAQSLFGLSAWIAFLIWTYRMNVSLQWLRAEILEFTPGWTIGWYFVPIANLWKPYRIMAEIWRASRYPSPNWQDESATPLLALWWGLWLGTVALGRAAGRLFLRAEDVNEFVRASYVALLSDALDMPLYVLFVILVGSTTSLLLRQVEDLSAGSAHQSEGIGQPQGQSRQEGADQ